MGANFWIQFAINEAVNLAAEFIDSSKISPALKSALEAFVAAGQNVLGALKL